MTTERNLIFSDVQQLLHVADSLPILASQQEQEGQDDPRHGWKSVHCNAQKQTNKNQHQTKTFQEFSVLLLKLPNNPQPLWAPCKETPYPATPHPLHTGGSLRQSLNHVAGPLLKEAAVCNSFVSKRPPTKRTSKGAGMSGWEEPNRAINRDNASCSMMPPLPTFLSLCKSFHCVSIQWITIHTLAPPPHHHTHLPFLQNHESNSFTFPHHAIIKEGPEKRKEERKECGGVPECRWSPPWVLFWLLSQTAARGARDGLHWLFNHPFFRRLSTSAPPPTDCSSSSSVVSSHRIPISTVL